MNSVDMRGSIELSQAEIKDWLDSGEFQAADCVVEEIEIAESEYCDLYCEEADFVEQLEIGSWMEFRIDQKPVVRARLAAIDPVKHLFVFTDQKGFIALTRSRNGLITDVRRGWARSCSPAQHRLQQFLGKLMGGSSERPVKTRLEPSR